MHYAIHHLAEKHRASELQTRASAHALAHPAARSAHRAAPRGVGLRHAVGWAMVHTGLRLVQSGAGHARHAHP